MMKFLSQEFQFLYKVRGEIISEYEEFEEVGGYQRFLMRFGKFEMVVANWNESFQRDRVRFTEGISGHF